MSGELHVWNQYNLSKLMQGIRAFEHIFFEILCTLFCVSPPWFCKTFVCNFHQGVEGDPRFSLVDELSLSLLVDLERLREL